VLRAPVGNGAPAGGATAIHAAIGGVARRRNLRATPGEPGWMKWSRGVIQGSPAVPIVCTSPGIGSGKSRLRPLLGAEAVAALVACFIRNTAAALDAVPCDIGRQRHAIFSPAGSDATLRPLLPPE
jgi:hypothetical protein